MIRIWLYLLRFLSIGVVLAALCIPAGAQALTAPVQAETRDLETLLVTIENDAARKKFADQLRALIAVQRQATEKSEDQITFGARLLTGLAKQVREVNRAVIESATALKGLPAFGRWMSAQIEDSGKRSAWALFFLKLGAIALVASGAYFGTVRGLLNARRAIEVRQGAGVGRVLAIGAMAILDTVPVAIFAGSAYGLMAVLELDHRTQLAAVTLVNAFVASGAILILARFVLAPYAQAFRPLAISDETAHYAYIWIRRLTFFAVFGYFVSQVASLVGMPSAAVGLTLKLTGLMIAGLVVVLILQNRATVAVWLHGSGDGGWSAVRVMRRRVSEIWHILAIFYILAICGVWVFDVAGGIEYLIRGTVLSIGILTAARLLFVGIEHLLRRGFAVKDELRRSFPGLEQRANRYVPVFQMILHLMVGSFAGFALLEAWGLDAFSWLATETGRRISGSVFSIVVTIVLALAIWETVNAAIQRYLGGNEATGGHIERSQRARTLLPLARATLSVVLVIVAALVVLSELGINIGPLLAGAGVVGLAIGFGSQKLVQDVITGAFILIEDAISVGDVVEMADHSGLVEAISIRSVRLRDLNGNVHTVPFSAVSTVVNMTKDYSQYLLDVGVSYRENTDRVVEVLREIDGDLRKDAEIGKLILEPIEILGVDRFEDSAVIIRARIKTLPTHQWTVGREFNRRMKMRFDELGIEIPFPHRTIYFGVDKKDEASMSRVKLDSVKSES